MMAQNWPAAYGRFLSSFHKTMNFMGMFCWKKLNVFFFLRRLAFHLNKLWDIQDATWWFVSMMKWYIHKVCGQYFSEMKSATAINSGQEMKPRKQFFYNSFHAIYVLRLVTWRYQSHRSYALLADFLIIFAYLISFVCESEHLLLRMCLWTISAVSNSNLPRLTSVNSRSDLASDEAKKKLTHKQTLIFISVYNRLAVLNDSDHVKSFLSVNLCTFHENNVVMLNDRNSLKMIFYLGKDFRFSLYENKRNNLWPRLTQCRSRL